MHNAAFFGHLECLKWIHETKDILIVVTEPDYINLSRFLIINAQCKLMKMQECLLLCSLLVPCHSSDYNSKGY